MHVFVRAWLCACLSIRMTTSFCPYNSIPSYCNCVPVVRTPSGNIIIGFTLCAVVVVAIVIVDIVVACVARMKGGAETSERQTRRTACSHRVETVNAFLSCSQFLLSSALASSSASPLVQSLLLPSSSPSLVVEC